MYFSTVLVFPPYIKGALRVLPTEAVELSSLLLSCRKRLMLNTVVKCFALKPVADLVGLGRYLMQSSDQVYLKIIFLPSDSKLIIIVV